MTTTSPHSALFQTLAESVIILIVLLTCTIIDAQDIVQLTDYTAKDLSSDPTELVEYGEGFMIRLEDGSIVFYNIQKESYSKIINDQSGELLTAGDADDYEGLFAIEYERRLYFTAQDPAMGPGLFVFDGMETFMIAPIQPDDYDDDLGRGAKIVFNGLLYAMLSPDPNIGLELYTINPNNDIELVADLTTGTTSSYADNFVVYGEQLLYSFFTPTYGQELWVIDDQGQPKLVKDIRAGVIGSFPQEPMIINDLLVLSIDDGVIGRELWVYDGNQINPLKDIVVGPGSGQPEHLILIENELYFSADENLYKSDGTTIGTVPLTTEEVDIDEIIEYGKKLYFRDNGHIWKSDGTVLGTIEIDRVGNPRKFISTENHIVIFSSAGRMYTTDGSIDGATELNLTDDFNFTLKHKAWTVGSTVYFEGNTKTQGNELWQINQAKEVSQTANFNTRTDGLTSQVVYNDQYLYYLYDSILFQSDGTIEETTELTNLSNSYREYRLITSWKNDVYINADIPGPEESVILKYCPSTDVITIIDTIQSYISDHEVIKLENRFYMIGSEDVHEVYGTPGSTVFFDRNLSQLADYYAWNGDLYHTLHSSSNANPNQLFKNGELLYKFGDNSGDGLPSNFTVYNGKLYFSAWTQAAGRELWVTDGTEAGTKLVIDFFGPNQNLPWPMIATDDYLFYGVSVGGTNYLMRSDGTAAGTTSISSDRWFHSPVIYKEEVYFSSYDSIGYGIWKTDGTLGGTTLTTSMTSSGPFSFVSDLIVVDDYLYFRGKKGATGTELWRTTGDAPSTTLVEDLYPGPKSSFPNDFEIFKGHLTFMAKSEITDAELFMLNECQGGVNLTCSTLPCDLSSTIIRSAASIAIASEHTIPTMQHVTTVSAEGLDINAVLNIENGSTLQVRIGGCN